MTRCKNGRAFRILAVIDQWSRESVCLEASSGCPGDGGSGPGLACSTTRMVQGIHRGDDTELTSKARDEWACRRGGRLDNMRPGKPTDNGLIESFNGPAAR